MIPMNSSDVIPHLEAIPEERRLVRRARAGDPDAFVQLYDAYGDDLYRYVYFRVMSDVAAEGITSHVFRYAWEHLQSKQSKHLTFVAWIYQIARYQVLLYYKANLRTRAFDIGFLSVAADYGLTQDAQDHFNIEAWNHHLRLLAADANQSRLQETAALIMRKYLDYISPRRVLKPSPTFNAYTRGWLPRYLETHARRPRRSPMIGRILLAYSELARSARLLIHPPEIPHAFQRMSVIYAILVAAFLVTGTARAQSALPGDAMYGWKRTSEQAWLSVSPDPVGTEIILANRRLEEWIAVGNDSTRNAGALADYSRALTYLNTTSDNSDSQTRIKAMIEAHREKLQQSGLSSTPLNDYLPGSANPGLAPTSTELSVTALVPSSTPTATQLLAAATEVPTEVAATVTEVPTEVPPTATEVPTEVLPTATEVPTEVPPTATEVPTEVPPTATEVPTEVPPTATEVPTEVPSTETEAPTPADNGVVPPADTPAAPPNPAE
jgi:DNA-directed RNA polymerase specialized sigma24 family protein